MNRLATGLVVSMLVLAAASARAQVPKAAEPSVAAANARVLAELPFADRQDFDDAMRGFIATSPNEQNHYQFLQQATAPPTVNPSLWRLAQLNALNGLFKIADGVYQVRGFSLANMTIVEGATGIIVVDPLLTAGSSGQAIDIYFQHRPKRPVVAVVYTHSHVDHYGGVKGVTSEADVASGRTKVLAPVGFMDAAVSEFVIAGNAMARRAQYQFGIPLPRGERGNVDAGVGKFEERGAPSNSSIIAPTDSITQPVETRTIDGVRFVFQLVPASEAPAGMDFFLPHAKVLDVAENASHVLHNLLPLRGSEVRDAKRWSDFLGAALEQFGADAEVLVGQHHWPVWGNERVTRALRQQRNLYKFVHDQSVRMMNQGYTPTEIAESLTLPPSLAKEWSARSYYGTLSHNSKAVYQKYLGWYDGNPSNLNSLTPTEAGKKVVEYMGGAAAVIARARSDFEQGNYRWVAQVMSHVVFADPGNKDARALAADAFEQMGYLAESATWRNAYLLGAQELRSGPPAGRRSRMNPDMLHAMPLDSVFDVLSTQVIGAGAQATRIVVNWRFTDTGQRLASTLEDGALTYVVGKEARDSDVSVTLTRAAFEAILLGAQTLATTLQRGMVATTGNAGKLTELMSLLDEFDASFPVIEPRTGR
jgi:alkyl sulfatase BDS1-like metallo-beta-lactamase superfamily hydrolase